MLGPACFAQPAMVAPTARVVAVTCAARSTRPVAISRRPETTLLELKEDRVTARTFVLRRADPGGAAAASRVSFLARHRLAHGAREAASCAAGLREVAERATLEERLEEVEE